MNCNLHTAIELEQPQPLEWALAGFLVPRRDKWDISHLLLNGEKARKRMCYRRVVAHGFAADSGMVLHTHLHEPDDRGPLMAGLLELCLRDGFTKGFSPKPCLFSFLDRNGIKREVVPDALLHFHGWVTSPQKSRPLLVTLRSNRTSAGSLDFVEQDAAITAEARRHGLSHVVLTESDVFSDYLRNIRLLGRVALPWHSGSKRDPHIAQTVRRRGPIRISRLVDFLGVERARTNSMPLSQARSEVLASLCRTIYYRELQADLSSPLGFDTVVSLCPENRPTNWSPFAEWTKRCA
jgi:hypothetical protein